jgi:hypothetical protein
MPPTTNALKYQQGYIQSNTERYVKFRDEAYKELMDRYGDELAYRKLLADREKELLKSIADEKAAGAKAAGKGMSELDYIAQRQRISADRSASLEDSAKRRIGIEQGKKGEFNIPTSVSNKISDANKFLSTSGTLLKTPADAEAGINAQIDAVAQSWTPGDRSALGAGQQLLNVVINSPVYNQLSPAQKAAVVSRISDRAGLSTLNVAGISGSDLLTSPLDQLVTMEVEDELKSYGAAYTSDFDKNLKLLDESWAKQKAAAAEAGKKPEEVSLPSADEIELKTIRDQLNRELGKPPTEAQVRALAREKFEPEASPFLKKQFEREVYSTDADQSKIIHYDAIQSAKKMKLNENSKAYAAARSLVESENKQMTPAQLRDATLKAAVDFSGGDISKRDELLQNYHALKMKQQREKYEPAEPVKPPRPDPFASEPSPGGRLSETPGPRGFIPTNEEGYAVDSEGNVRQPLRKVPPMLRERPSPGFLLNRISGGINQLAGAEDVQTPQFPEAEYGELSAEQRAAIINAEKEKKRQNLARRIVGMGTTDMDMNSLFKLDI